MKKAFGQICIRWLNEVDTRAWSLHVCYQILYFSETTIIIDCAFEN